jgi:hypothetical protein
MKAEADMRRPVLLLISKGKDDIQIFAGQDIVELERNPARVLYLSDGFGWEPITQGRVLLRNQYLGSGKNLCPNETMVSSPDFLAFVQRMFSQQTMDVIAHYSGVAFPSASRDARVPVPIQITRPVASRRAFRYADQFSPVIANDDPCLVLEIDYFVEVLSVLFKASMLKSHILKKTPSTPGSP